MSKSKRQHGTGSIYQRTVNGNFYLQYMVNGNLKKISLKTKNRKDAETKAEQILKPISEKNIEQFQFQIAENRKILAYNEFEFNNLIEQFSSDNNFKNLVTKTQKKYIRNWKRFVSFIIEKYNINNILALTKIHVKDFFDNLETEKVGVSTYNIILKDIKIISNYTAKNHDVVINCFNNINLKKTQPSLKKEFTPEQLKKIFAVVDGDYKILFSIGLYTGLRLKDCIMLNFSNISFKNKIITVITSKNQTKVVIPLHPELEKILKGIDKKDGYIMPELVEQYNIQNKSIVNVCQQIFKSVRIKTSVKIDGIKNKKCQYGFHSFRHTFVSMCQNQGVSLAVIQSIVGHSAGSKITDKVYTHISNEAKEAINSISITGEKILTDTCKIRKIKALISDNPTEKELEILAIIG